MSLSFGLHFSCSSLVGGDWPDLYAAAIEQTKLAEALGFDCALVSEHHFLRDGWIPSPIVLCGAFAAVTTRIRIGTDIIVLPLHHPVTVAEDILVLDNLTRGRAICGVGLGAGAREFEVYGVPFKQRVSRSEEAMTLVRRLMAEEEVVHQGRYFTLDGVTVTPRPVQQPAPPIWYGSVGEPGGRRAARLADALVLGPTPDLATLMKVRKAYDDELAALGRRPSEGRVILRREAYIAEDAPTAWAEALGPLKYQYSRVYTHVDRDISDEAFREHARDRFIVGGPDEFVEEARRYQDALGVELILFRLQFPGLPDERVLNATRLLGERVLPRVQ